MLTMQFYTLELPTLTYKLLLNYNPEMTPSKLFNWFNTNHTNKTLKKATFFKLQNSGKKLILVKTW